MTKGTTSGYGIGEGTVGLVDSVETGNTSGMALNGAVVIMSALGLRAGIRFNSPRTGINEGYKAHIQREKQVGGYEAMGIIEAPRSMRYIIPEPSEFNRLLRARQTEGGSLSIKSEEFLKNSTIRISEDGKTGFGLTKPDKDGVTELFNVFSLERGRGKKLILEALREAKKQGAKKIILDAFEINSEGANLKKFYEGAGFIEYRREKNWTEGQPSITYMELIL